MFLWLFVFFVCLCVFLVIFLNIGINAKFEVRGYRMAKKGKLRSRSLMVWTSHSGRCRLNICYARRIYIYPSLTKTRNDVRGRLAVLDRKAWGTVRLSLSPLVALNIAKEKTTVGLFKALQKTYKKHYKTRKVYLMKNLLIWRWQMMLSWMNI